MTCESCILVVTVGARRGSEVFDAVRIQRGPRPQIPADSRPVADASGALIRSGRVAVRQERPAAGSEGAFAGRSHAARMPDSLGDGLRRITAGRCPVVAL
jgi:hypothetical protein